MPGQLGVRVLAHGEGASSVPGPADFGIAAVALAALLLSAVGVRRLRRSSAGRGVVPPWRVAAFVVGVLVAVGSVSAPVEHAAGELFAAHMAQHLLLAFVAAPLLVLGRPLVVSSVLMGHRAATLARPLRRAAVRTRGTATAVVALCALQIAPWFVWHAPPAYDLALRLPAVHVVEHVTLVLSGTALTWLAVGRVPTVPALATIVAGMMSMGVVAAVLAFAAVPLYAGHLPTSRGLTELEDQQLGGALMWFPGSLAYLVAAAALVLGRLVRAPVITTLPSSRPEPR